MLIATHCKARSDMLHLVANSFQNILEKTEAADLKELVELRSGSKVNYLSTFSEVRRLMLAATPKILKDSKPDLNSVASIKMLLKYITRTKALWKSTRMDEHKSLTTIITALLEEAEAQESITVDTTRIPALGLTSNSTAGNRLTTCSAETKHLLLEAVATQEYTFIEDRLRAHEKGLPLPDGGDAELAKSDKKLKATKHLPVWYHLSKMCLSQSQD